MADPRKEILVTNEIYHIFNKSIVNDDIFIQRRYLIRALELTDFYRFPQIVRYSKFKNLSSANKKGYLTKTNKQKPLVEICSFSFMPNHYHFLLKQASDNGIVKFISNFQNSFAKYFNQRSNREGSLFKRPFKSRRITSEEELVHMSRYIHLNPVTSFLLSFKQLKSSELTSFPYYLGIKNDNVVNTDIILSLIGSKKTYLNFVSNQVDYQRKLSKIKRLLLE